MRRLVSQTLGSFSRNAYDGKSALQKDPLNIAWEVSFQLKEEMNSQLDINIQCSLSDWNDKRKTVYSREGIDEKHNCTLECVSKGNIDVICDRYNLYGCIESGKFHICKTDGSCNNTITNADSVILCLFSKRILSSVVDYRPFGSSNSNKASSEKGDADESGGCDMSESSESETEEEVLDPLKVEGENTDEMDGELMKFLGIVNLNNSNTLERYTGRKRKRKTKTRKVFIRGNPVLYSEAKSIINDLLFDDRVRRMINEKKEIELQKKGADEVRKYYKSCKKTNIMPSIHCVDSAYDEAINQKRLLPDTSRYKHLVDRYALICCKLWSRAMDTPFFVERSSGFHFCQHVMGSLYVMQHGLRDATRTVTILPEDKFLYMSLPSQSDLQYFTPTLKSIKAYRKCDITKGKNNMKESFNTATLEFCVNLSKEIQAFYDASQQSGPSENL